MATQPSTRIVRSLATLCLAFSLAMTARGQNTQPVWWPPTGLYGRPVAQPYFDFPPWARYMYCRPAPLMWGYDPFPNYGPGECAEPGVPSINCPGDFVAHRPNAWYASADFAPLTMDYGTDIYVARQFLPPVAGDDNSNPPDGDFVDPTDVAPLPARFSSRGLNTNSLHPEFDAGGKFTIGRRVFGCYRIEGTYTGLYNWESNAGVVSSTADLSSILSGFALPTPDPVFDSNTSVAMVNRSRLQSAEMNVRYWLDMPPGPFDVSVLVGGRYMQINEGFLLQTINAGGTNTGYSATQNDLWGVQIGIAGDWLLHPRFWINFDLKGGIYNNRTALNYNIDSYDNAFDRSGEGGADRTAFVGDLALVGHWQMTPWLVFNLGYQALFVEGIATGFNNLELQALSPPVPPGIASPVDDSGRVVYHGPVIGLMGVW